MKYATLMKYWAQKPTLMEALIQKHYLLSRGFKEVGISSIRQTSPEFNKEVIEKLQGAEEVAKIPVFSSGLSMYLGGQETIIEGKYQFYALFPEEEEEKIPDTLPGGFRAERQFDLFENPASPFRTIKRKLPSYLLHELDDNLILHENVHKFYFEPNQNADEKRKLKHTLTLDDILILSRMEHGNSLDTVQLRNKHSNPEDRKAGKRLDDHLSRSPLVMRVSKSSVYALSPDALDGMYAAEVHKKYLPADYI